MGQDFAGKTVLVSGGARGQGASHSRAFAAEGAKVLLGDIRDELGEETAQSIRDAGGQALYTHLDVRSTSDWDAAVALAESEFGSLNILINNAGVAAVEAFEDTTDEGWSYVMDTNGMGVFKGTRAAVPALRRAGGGAIVNTASMMGIVGSWGYAAYIASKFAVVGMTKSAALTYGRDNIRVNAVAPGCVDTPMLAEERAIMATNPYWDFEEWIASQAIPKIAAPEEISNMMMYLASEKASYITGSIFSIDGGLTAG